MTEKQHGEELNGYFPVLPFSNPDLSEAFVTGNLSCLASIILLLLGFPPASLAITSQSSLENPLLPIL